MEQLEQIDTENAQNICRQCYECKETKLLTEYYKDRTQYLGYKAICRDCFRKNLRNSYTKLTHEDMVGFIESKELIPGKHFKVLEYFTSKESESGKVIKVKRYIMECECGTIKEATLTTINRSISCASLECKFTANSIKAIDSIIKESVVDGFFVKAYVWESYIKGAVQRNIEFNITIEDVVELWKKQEGRCNKSGHKLTPGKVLQGGEGHTWSINRIDSKKGYVKGNIELTAKFVNILHNKYDEEPVDLYCMKRVVWLMKNNREYAEQLKEICRMDEEDPSVLDSKWKSANKMNNTTNLFGNAKRPFFKIDEILENQNEIPE